MGIYDGLPNVKTLTDTTTSGSAPDTAEAFIRNLYKKYLGRDMDAGAIAAYVDPIRQGIKTTGQIEQQFAGSPEAADYAKRVVAETTAKEKQAGIDAKAAADKAAADKIKAAYDAYNQRQSAVRSEWTPKLAAEYKPIEERQMGIVSGQLGKQREDVMKKLSKSYAARFGTPGGAQAAAEKSLFESEQEALSTAGQEIGNRSALSQRQELQNILAGAEGVTSAEEARQFASSEADRGRTFSAEQATIMRDWTEKTDKVKMDLQVQLAEKQYDRETNASIWNSIGNIIGIGASFLLAPATGGLSLAGALANYGVQAGKKQINSNVGFYQPGPGETPTYSSTTAWNK